MNLSLETLQEWIRIYLLERRTLLVATVCIAIGLLLWPLGIWPLWNQLGTTRSQVQRTRSQVNQITARADVLQKLNMSQREDMRRTEAALPLQRQPFTALLGINAIASQSGVLLNSYDLSPGVVSTDSADTQPTTTSRSATGVQTFPIEIALSGTLPQMQSAFRLLESNLPLFEIVEYSISTESNASDEAALVTSNLTLRMFSAPLQAGQFAKSTASPLTSGQQSVVDRLRTFTISEPPALIPETGLRFNNPNYLAE